MQKLNRFVTYIYSYRNNQRDTNVGFAKVDCRGGIVRLEIQIRKKMKETQEAQICFLTGSPMQPEAVPIGKMNFEKETGIYKGRFPANELGGSRYTFEQVTGLYIRSEQELFASQWTQEEIRIAGVSILNIEKQKEEEQKKEEQAGEFNIEEEHTEEQYAGELQTGEQQIEEQCIEERTAEKQRMQKRRDRATLRATEAEPQYDWRYEWEKLDQSPGNELVFGLALWTRNKGKS